jgi:hypothetical protein
MLTETTYKYMVTVYELEKMSLPHVTGVYLFNLV